MRLWNLNDRGKISKAVIKCKNRKSGLRAIPTSCTYSRDGLLGIITFIKFIYLL